MNRFVRTCLFGSLALAFCLAVAPPSRSADDDDDKEDIKEAQKATEKLKGLIDAIADGKANAVPALAKALNDKTDLKHIMWAAYKPRDKAGIGVGGKGDADGIEVKLMDLGKKPLMAAQLKAQSADLIRMAQVAQAMNEIAELNTPTKNVGKKLIIDWTKFNTAQKNGANVLINAVNKNDPKAVQTAATNLYSSCTNCHAAFRD
jgi:hypothetical protein